MNPYALHGPADRSGLRWALSGAVIAALHAGLIAGAIYYYREAPPPGAAEPAIMIDMAPATAAPESQPNDTPPGPEMQQAEEQSAPPEPTPPQPAEQPIEPLPQVVNPEVETPPEPKAEPRPEAPRATPEPPKPEQPKPPLEKPKPLRAEVRTKSNPAPPAPRTSAPPRSQQRAAIAAAAMSAGAVRAAADYGQVVRAHLLRFMRYPTGSRAGLARRVTAQMAFTLDRSGRVLSARITASSGHAPFDADALATIRRATPFPPFPPELREASRSFYAPMSYDLP